MYMYVVLRRGVLYSTRFLDPGNSMYIITSYTHIFTWLSSILAYLSLQPNQHHVLQHHRLIQANPYANSIGLVPLAHFWL
jgi:hypothetical protein